LKNKAVIKKDLRHLDFIHTDLKEINGIKCMITARVMNSLFSVELSTTLDETEWVIKPEVHSEYIQDEYK